MQCEILSVCFDQASEKTDIDNDNGSVCVCVQTFVAVLDNSRWHILMKNHYFPR